MKVISYFICFLPYVLVLLFLYLINNLIVIRQRKGKLNIKVVIAILMITAALVIYYLPMKNIIEKYNLRYIQVQVYEGIYQRKSVTIEDKSKMDMILQVINNYTFTRSAVRTTQQQNFAGSQFIMFSTSSYDNKTLSVIHLYILKDQPRIDALQINDQMYNVRDKKGLDADIYEALGKLEILDK